MSKKVLILTSSPRENSITKRMAEAFAEGAREAGHEIFYFDAAEHQMKGCRACNACWSNGEACALDPEFNKFAALMEKCDVLLLSTPLYWFSLPAQVKVAIDKLYAYGGSGGPRPLTVKESYFFVCGGNGDKAEYKPVLDLYQMIADYLKWTNRGILQTGGIGAPGKLEASGVLERAKEMGRNV